MIILLGCSFSHHNAPFLFITSKDPKFHSTKTHLRTTWPTQRIWFSLRSPATQLVPHSWWRECPWYTGRQPKKHTPDSWDSDRIEPSSISYISEIDSQKNTGHPGILRHTFVLASCTTWSLLFATSSWYTTQAICINLPIFPIPTSTVWNIWTLIRRMISRWDVWYFLVQVTSIMGKFLFLNLHASRASWGGFQIYL